MATESDTLSDLVKRKYRHGFVTDIEQETVPPGLSEALIVSVMPTLRVTSSLICVAKLLASILTLYTPGVSPAMR